MAKTTAERAADLKQRRKDLGQHRVEFWLTLEEKMFLNLQLKIFRDQTSTRHPR